MGGFLGLEVWQLALLGVAALGAVGIAAVNFRFSMFLCGTLLFLSAISQQLTWNLLLVRTIITQFQQQRSSLYLATGGLLLLAAVMHVQRLRFRSTPLQSWLLLVIGVYAGLIRMLASDVADGLASIGFAAVTLIPLAVVPPSLIRSWWDMYILPRAVGVACLLWSSLCVVQFVVNRRALTTGYLTQRFVGMTGNPQHASAFLAFSLICCVFLVLNDPKTRYRLVWMGTAAIAAVFLLWTASRTGVAMAAIGVAACFYGRAGSAILLLPIVGGVGYTAYSFLAGQRVDFDVERFTTGGQTRAAAWQELLRDFTSNPVFGNGGTGVKSEFRAEKSENSLLYGLATYGAGMGMLVILLALASLLQIIKLVRVRRSMQPYQRRLVEYLIGMQAAFWGGSIFEGYIIGRVSSPIIFMMFFAAMASRAIELAAEEQAAGVEYAPEGEDTYELPPEYAEAYAREDHAPAAGAAT